MTPPVYVINMPASRQRLANVSASLSDAGIDFERVEAIDAGSVPLSQLLSRYDPAQNRRRYFAPLSPGEVACFLSHRRAWAHFLVSSVAFGIFLEDDVEAQCSRTELFDLLAFLETETRPTLIKLFRPQTNFASSGSEQRRSISCPLVCPLGAVAQAMNRPAAEALLAATEQFHEPVDVAIQRWWDFGIRILQVTPNLFEEVSHKSGGSTVQYSLPFMAKCRRELVRPTYQLVRLLRSVSARAKILALSRNAP